LFYGRPPAVRSSRALHPLGGGRRRAEEEGGGREDSGVMKESEKREFCKVEFTKKLLE